MNFKIYYIDKYHVELLQTVYRDNVKIESTDDGEYFNATIKDGTLIVTQNILSIGGVDFHFSDYGNVIIY